jgi:hypothetical protein
MMSAPTYKSQPIFILFKGLIMYFPCSWGMSVFEDAVKDRVIIPEKRLCSASFFCSKSAGR